MARLRGLFVPTGTVFVSLIAISFVVRWERPFPGMALLFLTFLPFGFTGLLPWLHAYVGLPHAR